MYTDLRERRVRNPDSPSSDPPSTGQSSSSSSPLLPNHENLRRKLGFRFLRQISTFSHFTKTQISRKCFPDSPPLQQFQSPFLLRSLSMDESHTALPSSYLLGSVPAVIDEGTKISKSSTSYEVPEANLQNSPPINRGGSGRGYQSLGSPTENFEQQPANNWKGVFSIASYIQYFNVDTDVVVNRLISSVYPSGDFFNKIDANPDLYGAIWISTTLVFLLASLGNCATYLMDKRSDSSTSWSFDVNYVNVAAGVIYGYSIAVPLAFYFLLQYMGSNASLVRFWCMWGYSLSIFIPSTFLLLIPVEFLRWIIILLVGAASSFFVGLNLKSFMESTDLTIMAVASFFLQLALAIFLKVWFFP